MIRKNLYTLGILTAFILFLLATFGATFATHGGHGNFHCPLTPNAGSFCNIDLFAHLENWKTAFSSISGENYGIYLAILLILIVVRKIFSLQKKYLFFNKLRKKPERDQANKELISNEIFSALRRGIIHSRVYPS
mgnify:CR=1 FL=1